MSQVKYLSLFLFIIIVPLAVYALFSFSHFHMKWNDLHFHSALEIFGAIVAVLTAFLLYLKVASSKEKRYIFMSFSFLSMGILDGIHAFTELGDAFVFSHSIASLYGSAFAFMVWFTPIDSFIIKHKRVIFSMVALFSILTGVTTFIEPWPSYLSMFSQDGLSAMQHSYNSTQEPAHLIFSPLAISINMLAGIFFMAASLYFFLRYIKYQGGGN